VQQLPQLFRPVSGQGVFDNNASPQPLDIFGRIGPGNSIEARSITTDFSPGRFIPILRAILSARLPFHILVMS
jgi:hypothetical protein